MLIERGEAGEAQRATDESAALLARRRSARSASGPAPSIASCGRRLLGRALLAGGQREAGLDELQAVAAAAGAAGAAATRDR